MIRTMRAALAVLALALGCLTAAAQTSFTTPGGSGVDGKVMMCLNGSNQAVPCSSATPLQVTGGGGGAATIADGANVTQGSIGDSPWSGTGNGTLDAIMKAIYNAVISPPTPGSTTGGLTFVTKTGINGTPQQIGTTGAHQVYVEHCDNGTSALNTANTYLQYYDTATTPTFGTSVTFADPIAGSLTDGFALSLVGGQIANGIWITAATAPSGNTAPTNSLTCLFGYK